MDSAFHRDFREKVDGVETASSDDVNILREKTFNDELRQLIERIEDNTEPQDSIHAVMSSTDFSFDVASHFLNSEPVDRGELVERLHQLYYLAEQSEGKMYPHALGRIPLLSGSRNIMKDEYLKSAMDDAGLPLFALLKYSFLNKAFLPFITTLPRGNEDIAIHIKGGIYERLKEGIVLLNQNDIKNDIFYSKVFGALELSTNQLLTVISLSQVASEINRNITESLRSYNTLGTHSGILLFITDRPIDEDGPLLRQTLLSVLSHYDSLFFDNSSSHEIFLNHLDYFLEIYGKGDDRVGFRVSSNFPHSREIYGIFSYLVARLEQRCSPDTKILQFTLDAVCLLASVEDIGAIKHTIDEFNYGEEPILELYQHTVEEIRDSNCLLRRYFY